MPDLGSPASYLILADGTPVYASGGEELGRVDEILADPEVDVFDGLVVGVPDDGQRFVAAAQVDRVYERGVVLRIDATAAASLPAHG